MALRVVLVLLRVPLKLAREEALFLAACARVFAMVRGAMLIRVLMLLRGVADACRVIQMLLWRHQRLLASNRHNIVGAKFKPRSTDPGNVLFIS